MSNSNSPREMKVKKLPKGIFTWKVTLRLHEGHRLGYYDRYYEDVNPLTKAMSEYLEQNVNGKYSVHYVRGEATKRKNIQKADYILFDNQFDVTMFKLCFGDGIRKIYKLIVEKQVMEKAA